jgi:hypothetical protein
MPYQQDISMLEIFLRVVSTVQETGSVSGHSIEELFFSFEIELRPPLAIYISKDSFYRIIITILRVNLNICCPTLSAATTFNDPTILVFDLTSLSITVGFKIEYIIIYVLR